MDRKQALSDVYLRTDIIKLAIDQHGPVIRLSYMEIASGINRLLHRGIPKEVIAQVLSETIETLAKEAVTSSKSAAIVASRGPHHY
jgi:hypothetical protein